MARFFLQIFIFFCFVLPLQGQVVDTNIQLPLAEVSESRLNQFNTGAKLIQLDSALIQNAPNQNLAEVLANNSQIYIKNYGPGRLASTAIRGASASHTAVLWNGINLQNTFLGQVDLALLPSQATDAISIQYGGSSALYGSGAIGGSIHLDNIPQYNQATAVHFTSSIANFGQFQNQLQFKSSNAKWYSNTKLNVQNGTFDFPYTTSAGKERKQENATLQQLSIFQDLNQKINSKNEIGLHLWWQDVNREIPPLKDQLTSVAKQEDKALRTSLNWKYTGNQYAQIFRLAYIDENLIYTDSIAQINSDSKSESWVAESENRFYLSPANRINFGLHSTQIKARSNNFIGNQSQNRSAVFLSWKFQSKNNKWKHSFNFRQELIDGKTIPFTPSLGFDWVLSPSFRLKGTINRNYRVPTLNDRFFNPGGNPDIQPESGWSQSIGLYLKKRIRQHQFYVETSLFNRNIDNWIIWLPQSNFWAPENIQEVWSRGLEHSFKWKTQIQSWLLSANIQYDYVRSTNQKSKRPNDASLGKQLIYVPKHKVLSNFSAQHKTWRLHFWHNYNDKVFLSSDNAISLPGFWLSHLSLGKKISIRKSKLDLRFKVHNLWNKDYEVVVSRPMPGRYFEFGINLHIR